VNSLVIDEVVSPDTIVVTGKTYIAHQDPSSGCGLSSRIPGKCAFYSSPISCRSIPCTASQLRRIGNTNGKDVVWLAKE
jgi:hypothetical protein